MSKCDRAETLRDYAFDELPALERAEVERHIVECGECAAELDQLRLTTAALRMLPDREVPQRIAFVSDKVFQPSWLSRAAGQFWNFASAAMLAVALILTVYHRDPVVAAGPVRTVVQKVDVSQQQIDAAVAKAVAQVREDDAKLTRAALERAELKHGQEHQDLLEAIRVLQARANYQLMASNDTQTNPVAGQ